MTFRTIDIKPESMTVIVACHLRVTLDSVLVIHAMFFLLQASNDYFFSGLGKLIGKQIGKHFLKMIGKQIGKHFHENNIG